MSDRDDLLPRFDLPPVVEVALAVQFPEPLSFGATDVNWVAEMWSDEFPNCEVRESKEPFEPYHGISNEPQETALDRLWLTDSSDSRAVQLQPDRLTVNWQKTESTGQYPHYGNIEGFLIEAWAGLERLADRLGDPVPRVDVCDVLYVNRLRGPEGWHEHDDTARLIEPWNGWYSDGYLPEPSAFSLHLHYHLDDRGWLNIDTWEASDEEGDMLMLLLQSRGRLPEEACGFDDAVEFMRAAHEWIVRGFASVTTLRAHQAWERFR